MNSMRPRSGGGPAQDGKTFEWRFSRKFFTRFGFKVDDWQVLADTLKAVGISNPVTAVVQSSHGTRYTVDGPMQSPDGRMPRVRTVWIVESERLGPRLITAHPL